MKIYRIFYEFYPFNMDNLNPESENIEANNLEEAFTKLEKLKGKSNIEIFKAPAKKIYNE